MKASTPPMERPRKSRHPSASPAPVAGVSTPALISKPSKSAKRRAKAIGPVIDLTVDDDGELVMSDIQFTGGDDPQIPRAGPSRPRGEPPGSQNGEANGFRAVPKSLLSGLERRPSPGGSSGTASYMLNIDEIGESLGKGKERVRSRSPRANGNVLVEEVPKSPSRKADTDAGKHFDPPGLFSTSLMPELIDTPSGTRIELRRPLDDDSFADPKSKDDEALLLPSHVLLDSPTSGSTGELPQTPAEGSTSMEGLHFLDEDTVRGVARYFDDSVDEEGKDQTEEATFLAQADQSKICSNCKRPGHRKNDCPHFTCTVCGAEDDHERRDCPVTLVCYGCGQRGHRFDSCKNPLPSSQRRKGCDRCGAHDHLTGSCPSLWRVYAYRSSKTREASMSLRSKVEGWAKEAAGGAAYEEWCYNCSREGHLGDDCPTRRHSLAKLYTPSPFSQNMVTRGPFFASKPRNLDGAANHARWDDEGVVLPGVKVFEGARAGEKSKEKRKQSMMAESMREGEDEEEEEDWFKGKSNGRGGTGFNIRGRGGYRGGAGGGTSTPLGNRSERPWDSDPRRGKAGGGLPFGHGHLMDSAPAKIQAPQDQQGIRFGKLTLDTLTGPRNQIPNPTLPQNPITANDATPSRLPKKGNKKGNPALAVVNRALGLDTPKGKKRGSESSTLDSPSSSLSTPSSLNGANESGSRRMTKKRRAAAAGGAGGAGEGKDWESEWRSGGNGGGPVGGWGKEVDRKIRREKHERTQGEGHRLGSQGGGRGAHRGKGDSRRDSGGGRTGARGGGQRYTGGY